MEIAGVLEGTNAKFVWDMMIKVSLVLFRNSSQLLETKVLEKVSELREATVYHHREY